MKLIWIRTGISDLALDWLEKKAKRESQHTGASISRSDLIRRAIGEMRQRDMEASGKP